MNHNIDKSYRTKKLALLFTSSNGLNCTSEDGKQVEQVLQLHNFQVQRFDGQAYTKDSVLKHLIQALKNSTCLFLYFSCHSKQQLHTNKVYLQSGDGLFELQLMHILETIDFFRKASKNEFYHITIVFDCCGIGSTVYDQVLCDKGFINSNSNNNSHSSSKYNVNYSKTFDTHNNMKNSFEVISASQMYAFAFEVPNDPYFEGLSVLTYFLVRALKGLAAFDIERDYITVNELYTYIEKAMLNKSNKHVVNYQKPIFHRHGDGNMRIYNPSVVGPYGKSSSSSISKAF